MSSSSSSALQEVGGGGDGGNGGGNGEGIGGEFEGPSSSRRRGGNGVWPEPFLESLASQIALDASHSIGRLAAAQALSNLFRVCSTWRAVSRSDLLWQNLCRQVWYRGRLLQQTWHDEYIYWHQTSNNFRQCTYIYRTLQFIPTNNDNDNNDGLYCRRLALSDHHLAAGFSDGSVQLFHLPTRVHLSTFHPQTRDGRLGRYSRAVSGIILSDENLVFASLDGDIHVVVIGGAAPPRRAHLGDVVNDGALVDFTGCDQWWVGLYAGVPGRAFHIWNSETEELAFVGGDLTDPEAVMGWHLLTELTELVGRIRITAQDTAVACTSLRLIAINLRNQGLILQERSFQRGLIVASFDATNETLLAVDGRGIASVRRVEDLEEACRFNVRGASQRGVVGCMNNGYAVMCVGGVIRVWEVEHGVYLYSLRERVGDVNAIHVDERHIVACSSDGTIHLWDFGAQLH